MQMYSSWIWTWVAGLISNDDRYTEGIEEYNIVSAFQVF